MGHDTHFWLKQEYYKNPKICKCCNKPIDYHKRNLNDFCSNLCKINYKSLIIRIEYEQNPTHCKHCGEVLPFITGKLQREKRQFCNYSCSNSFTKMGNSINLNRIPWTTRKKLTFWQNLLKKIRFFLKKVAIIFF